MRRLLLTSLILSSLYGFAQDKTPVTFGAVTPADFVLPAGADTSAGAVVIADVGTNEFERGGFSSIGWEWRMKRMKRILILDRKAFDAATVSIPLFVAKSGEQEVTDLKANTYYLENGKVIKAELDKKSYFIDKVSESVTTGRFTFPAIREGCIVEYTYVMRSPFLLNTNLWVFQGKYPCLWSEFEAAVPSFFTFSIDEQGYLPFYIKTSEEKNGYFGTEGSEVRIMKWVMKNVPQVKEEPYLTTLKNYISRVDIRMSAFRYGNLYLNGFEMSAVQYGGVMFSWRQLDRYLLTSDKFGADLTDKNSWLNESMNGIVAGAGDELGKAKRIYSYVRDHFACTPSTGILMHNTLKTICKNKAGSESELNLSLIAMLRYEGLSAVPVVLSTRANGFFNTLVPEPAELNYVICKLTCGSKEYYLDASDPNISFGQLPLSCYNGYDVVVDSAVQFPELMSADSLTERKTVSVFLFKGDKGLDGTVQIYPGLAEAAEIRKKMKGQDGGQKFRDQFLSGPAAGTISDLEVDSVNDPDEPLVISYSCHVGPDGAPDIFYFTPILVDRLTTNPFKATERIYPVEMPCAKDANYILTMDIPPGYVVDELPKSEKLVLGDGSYFEYIASQDGDQIHFRTRTRMVRANYQPQEYAALRSFFTDILDKESEQIVFKKKK